MQCLSVIRVALPSRRAVLEAVGQAAHVRLRRGRDFGYRYARAASPVCSTRYARIRACAAELAFSAGLDTPANIATARIVYRQYVESIKVLGGAHVDNPHARALRKLAEKIDKRVRAGRRAADGTPRQRGRGREPKRGQYMVQTPANFPLDEIDKGTIYGIDSDEDWPAERLRKSDVLVGWKSTHPHARPLDCDLAFVINSDECYAGRILYTEGGGFTLAGPNGVFEYDADYEEHLGRIIHAERGGKIVQRFYSIPPPPNSPAESPATAQRIAELRRRLQKLLDEGEAHNESGIFRLEREIYKLEQEATRTHWPEYIGAQEGGA